MSHHGDPHQTYRPPPMHQAPPPPPNYAPVFVHRDDRKGGPSIESVTVPLLLVVTFAVFLVGSTYMATSQFHAVHTAIEKLGTKIDDVAAGIKQRLERLETDNGNNMTRKDH